MNSFILFRLFAFGLPEPDTHLHVYLAPEAGKGDRQSQYCSSFDWFKETHRIGEVDLWTQEWCMVLESIFFPYRSLKTQDQYAIESNIEYQTRTMIGAEKRAGLPSKSFDYEKFVLNTYVLTPGPGWEGRISKTITTIFQTISWGQFVLKDQYQRSNTSGIFTQIKFW